MTYKFKTKEGKIITMFDCGCILGAKENEPRKFNYIPCINHGRNELELEK